VSNPLADLFPRPSDDSSEHRRADLAHRAQLVRENGWAPYEALWCTGEVVGVAALLNDVEQLRRMGETLQTAWERWAFDLWGMVDGRADVDAGCRHTRRWFMRAAETL
jgi:hypothetical protein